MPGSAIHHVTDPEEYRRSIRPTRAEYCVTSGGSFQASVIKIDFHRLWMQRFQENLSRVWCLETKRFAIWFADGPGFPVRANGVEMGDTEIGLVHPSRTLWHTLSGPRRMGSMSLPADDLAELSATAIGRDLTARPDILSVSVPSSAMARLQRLHAAVGDVAKSAPEIIANPAAALGIEQSLIEALLACMSGATTHENTASRRRHTWIIKQFRAVAEEGSGQALYLPEVCKMLGVSLRTLNLCCNEHLGMSPKRYLTLRRLHLAREALRGASANAATVTEIATGYGFWELGRFAMAYRSTFGESPSATLRRLPD